MKHIIVTSVMLLAGIASAWGETRYKGDFNGDGELDLTDFMILASHIRNNTADPKVHDLNANGRVGEDDLDVLANIIINEQKIPDGGVNVGIGDWGDGGDYGGTVGGTQSKPHSRADSEPIATLSMADARHDYASGNSYNEIMAPSAGDFCGILMDVRIGSQGEWKKDCVLELAGITGTDHRLYGKPVLKNEEYELIVRAIVFSPTFTKLPEGAMLRMEYGNVVPEWNYANFSNSQGALCDATTAFSLTGPDPHYPRIGYTPITALAISPEKKEWNIDDRINVSATFTPEEPTDTRIEWASSDPSVVVYENDEFKALKAGNATLTARTLDGSDITATCAVTVVGTSANGVVWADENTRAKVYSISGILLNASASQSDFRELPAGIYIVVTPSGTHKVRR